MSSRKTLAVSHVLHVFQSDRRDHKVADDGWEEGDTDGGEDLNEHDVRVGFDCAISDGIAFWILEQQSEDAL